jgi:hypothetical protein
MVTSPCGRTTLRVLKATLGITQRLRQNRLRKAPLLTRTHFTYSRMATPRLTTRPAKPSGRRINPFFHEKLGF